MFLCNTAPRKRGCGYFFDVIVRNGGYWMFGCVEELTYEENNYIIATNLTGSIQSVTYGHNNLWHVSDILANNLICFPFQNSYNSC